MEAVSGYQGPGLGERSVRLAELDGRRSRDAVQGSGAGHGGGGPRGCTGAGDEPGQTDNDPTGPVDMGTPATSEPHNPGQTVEP